MSIHTFVIGPLPPPVHGMSKNTKIIADAVRNQVACTIIDLSAKALDKRRVRYHLVRLLAVLRGVGKLLIAKRAEKEIAYIAADSGWGMIYSMILLLIAKKRGCKLVVHHRSFRYIDRKSRLMGVIARVMLKSGVHVFLCQKMKSEFQKVYPVSNSLVVSNAGYADAVECIPDRGSRPLTLGLLSNLCREKGLHDFVALVTAAKESGYKIRAILAGPPATQEDSAFIRGAVRLHGEVIEYRGSVYGQQKHNFFEDIDVFVFPTRYRTEAQPNVLFESFAHARPVITFDRGCIGSDVMGAGFVVPRDEDFVTVALPLIERWSADVELLTKAQASAYDVARRHREAAKHGHSSLISILTR